ncbi:polysulfide reductase [Desulfitobacterium dichloroeliminans LMG P-21439]|uniref:Polysulfide reductase n=1 Tax=Desulfitobacterium dichloroeliminans (strain LMG P-21439 / DCA1) TaxID=871963 RepID=L0F7X9_DESDL|nr:NrfD/PsrC family molybdoenzyme membrane anchor subunit [Desulfitobacterium dichloroeliminans]AGA68766.1 polysulfide reductase [Desulfitobacterium dichloroeliminans LMG P-21439]
MEKRKYQKSLWTYLSLVLVAFALLGSINKYFISGEHAFGVTPDVPWGALISGYVFFAVAATGTGLVGSLGHVFRIKKFEVLSKRSLLASILLLLSAFIVLAVELSNPFKLIYLLFSPNLDSPIFWMGAFYGAYLILLFGEFYFTMKDNHKVATGIAYVSLLVKLSAIINLGRVFSYTYARGFWDGYYYPIYMVISAIVSGAAVLTIISYLSKDNSYRDQAQRKDLIQSLSKILAGALIVFAVFQGIKLGTALGSENLAVAEAAKSMVSGPMAIPFWVMEVLMGVVAPLFILSQSKFTSLGKSFAAALLAMLGLLFSRLDFVYAGQVVPLQITDATALAVGTWNAYSPTWSEWSLIIGVIGFVILMFDFAESKLSLDTHH